ncbi:MAG: hypothetical protein ACLSAC_17465 [Enterocloster bolteae]
MDFSDRSFCVLLGLVDPSLERPSNSDFSAIITLAKHKGTGEAYAFDADIERRHPDRIISDILEKERRIRRIMAGDIRNSVVTHAVPTVLKARSW